MGTVPLPHLFAVGDEVLADTINTYYTGITFLEQPPHLSIIQTTPQTLTSGTSALVTLDTIESDPYNGWNATNHDYVFQTAGWYEVLGGAAVAGGASAGSGARQAWTGNNNLIGTVYPKSYFTGTNNGTNAAYVPTRAYRAFFNVSDTLQLWTLQTSGVSLATVTLASFLQVRWDHS